jgi:hypothetical protein
LSRYRRYRLHNGKETTVLVLIALVVALFVLVTALGLPYSQSWYSRWGDYDR